MFGVEAVKERLNSLGYEVKGSEDFSLAFLVDKVKNTIKNETNQPEVPDGLVQIAVDMAVGEFLQIKKTFAPADLTGFDLDYAVRQLSEGDTGFTFAVGDGSQTPEQRLDALINYFLSSKTGQFSCYRRLVW